MQTADEYLQTERAQRDAEAIAGRLFIDGARDLSDEELERVLSYYGLVAKAKVLRDGKCLSTAESWIQARHYHTGGDDRGACMCDTPDVDHVLRPANWLLCGEPDRPRAGCGQAIQSGTTVLFADVEVVLCEGCTLDAEVPF